MYNDQDYQRAKSGRREEAAPKIKSMLNFKQANNGPQTCLYQLVTKITQYTALPLGVCGGGMSSIMKNQEQMDEKTNMPFKVLGVVPFT